MLNLLHHGEIVHQVYPGSKLDLGGVHVSPAVAGWTYGDYQLVKAPPPPEPEPPTPEELRAAMPPLTKRQLRVALVMNGIPLASVAAMIEGDA